MKTENADSNLEDVTKKLAELRKQAGVKSDRVFSQAGIHDEIDKTSAVTSEIESSGIADIAISDAMNTLNEISSELENPDIKPAQRKALKPYIDVARKQLESGSTDGLSAEDKKEYEKAVAKISKRLDTFEKIIKKGTGKGVGSQIGSAMAGKAGGMLVGMITQNPILATAYDAISAGITAKKENKQKAAEKLAATQRAQISELEQRKTSLEKGDDGGSMVTPEKPPMAELAQKAYDEQQKVTATPSGATPASAGIETPTLESQQILHEDLQELIEVNKSMVEVLKAIEEDTDDQRAIAEKSLLHADENRLEAARKAKAGMGKVAGVKKEEEAEEGFMAMLAAATGLVNIFLNLKALAVQFLPKIAMIGKAFKGIFKIFTRIFAIPLAIFGGLYKMITKWGESEGEDLPKRILEAIMDFVSGAFSALTFGLLDSNTIENAFRDVGRIMYDFLVDLWEWIKESLTDMTPKVIKTAANKISGFFGDTKEETEVNDLLRSSDTAKKAFKQDMFDKEIHIENESEMKKLSFPTLRKILTSPDATLETKEKIKDFLASKGELTRVRKPAGRMVEQLTPPPSLEQNMMRSDINQADLANQSSMDRIESSAASAPQQPVQINNTTNNNSHSMITKGVPETASKSTARDQIQYA